MRDFSLSLGLETTADESVSVSCAGKIEEEEQQQLQLLEQKDQVGQDETVPEQKENTPIAAPRDEILGKLIGGFWQLIVQFPTSRQQRMLPWKSQKQPERPLYTACAETTRFAPAAP